MTAAATQGRWRRQQSLFCVGGWRGCAAVAAAAAGGGAARAQGWTGRDEGRHCFLRRRRARRFRLRCFDKMSDADGDLVGIVSQLLGGTGSSTKFYQKRADHAHQVKSTRSFKYAHQRRQNGARHIFAIYCATYSISLSSPYHSRQVSKSFVKRFSSLESSILTLL